MEGDQDTIRKKDPNFSFMQLQRMNEGKLTDLFLEKKGYVCDLCKEIIKGRPEGGNMLCGKCKRQGGTGELEKALAKVEKGGRVAI